MFGLSLLRVNTKIRQTVELGMKSVWLRVICLPVLVHSLIVPIPVAYMQDPPNPVMGCGMIGFSLMKSPHSDDMWQDTPELSMDGDS